MRDLSSIAAGRAPDLGDSRAQRRQLLDMEDHLDQNIPRLVQSTDGHAYTVWGALQTEQVDVEFFPKLSPQARFLRPGEGTEDASLLDFRNRATVRRMEQSFSDYGLQDIADATEPYRGRFLGRANLAGTSPSHDFQVMWLGSRNQWHLSAGTIYKQEPSGAETLEFPIEAIQLHGKGWIVIPIHITIEPSVSLTPSPFTIQIDTPKMVETLLQDTPLRTLDVEINEDNGWSITGAVWTPGLHLQPIAYVEPPDKTHKVPRIFPVVVRSVTLPPLWSALWSPIF